MKIKIKNKSSWVNLKYNISEKPVNETKFIGVSLKEWKFFKLNLNLSKTKIVLW